VQTQVPVWGGSVVWHITGGLDPLNARFKSRPPHMGRSEGYKDETNYLDEKPPDVENPHDGPWEELDYDQQYYLVHRERRRDQIRSREDGIRSWVWEIKEDKECSRCEEDHPACLDFHHTGEKTATVNELVRDGASKETIQKEIENCTLMCANCHRKEHHGD
jgi:hypothetical protein